MTSFLLLNVSNCQTGIVSSFFQSLPTAALASGILITCGMGIKLVNQIALCHRIFILCLRCDLHDLSVEMIPSVVSWTHEPPRYMHGLSLESCWIHGSSHQFPELERFFVPFLQSMPHPLELPTFSSHFSFFIFSIFRIDEINASQSSSIIEYWLLVFPSLLFSLLSAFSQLWSILVVVWTFVNPFQESDKLRFAYTFQ